MQPNSFLATTTTLQLGQQLVETTATLESDSTDNDMPHLFEDRPKKTDSSQLLSSSPPPALLPVHVTKQQKRKWNVWTSESSKPCSSASDEARSRIMLRAESSPELPVFKAGIAPRDKSLPFASLIALEICAGSAGLTAALRQVGFDSAGIDCRRNRHRPMAPVATIDITQVEGQQVIDQLLESGRVIYAHMAPPCGTASRARDRLVSRQLRMQGAPSPPPLRSDEFPAGLPGTENNPRVQAANCIYEYLATVCQKCLELNISWTVENPTRSYMWAMPGFSRLIKDGKCRFVNFDSCMHGGRRKKASSWLTSNDFVEMDALAVQCDNSHAEPHLPWTVASQDGQWQFSTADEAAYPRLLCQRVAAQVAAMATRKGHRPPAETLDEDMDHATLLQRVATGKQPRGRKLPPLVAEFARTEVVESNNCELQKHLDSTGKLASRFFQVPKGSKLLSQTRIKRESKESSAPVNSSESQVSYVFGVYRTPEEFLEFAKALHHPRTQAQGLDDDIIMTVFHLLTNGPEATEARRSASMEYWSDRANVLQLREDALHEAMNPKVKQVLKEKRLLLLQEMIKESGHTDTTIAMDIARGHRLTGLVEDSNAFPSKVRLPSITEKALAQSAKWTRRAIIGSVKSSGSKDVDDKLYSATMDEVAERWLDGPRSESEITTEVGPLWNVSRRFPVSQGDKVRAIDDYSESFVNSAFGSLERISLGGIDEIAAIAKLFMDSLGRCSGDSRLIEVKLSSGQFLRGELHPSLSVSEAFDLVGRSLDLKSAYRQQAVSPLSQAQAVIAVHNPETGKLKFQNPIRIFPRFSPGGTS